VWAFANGARVVYIGGVVFKKILFSPNVSPLRWRRRDGGGRCGGRGGVGGGRNGVGGAIYNMCVHKMSVYYTII